LAALPMYMLVCEVAERVADGSMVMDQARYVVDELRPLIPALWLDARAGRPSRVAVEFPKPEEGQSTHPDFDMSFLQRSVERWVAMAPEFIRRRGVVPTQHHAVAVRS